MSTLQLSFYACQVNISIETHKSKLISCPVPDDKLLIGGGAYVQDSDVHYLLRASFPIDDGVHQKWGAIWTNPTDVDNRQVVSFTVHAICVDREVKIEKQVGEQRCEIS